MSLIYLISVVECLLVLHTMLHARETVSDKTEFILSGSFHAGGKRQMISIVTDFNMKENEVENT